MRTSIHAGKYAAAPSVLFTRRAKSNRTHGGAFVRRIFGGSNIRGFRVNAAAKSAADSSSWVEKYGSALDFGVSADQGLRDEMEDVAAVVPKGRCGFLYAGVFDGHAGVHVAQYLGEKLYERVVNIIDSAGMEMAPTGKLKDTVSGSPLATALPTVFEQLDTEILDWLKAKGKKGAMDEAGSTATCVFARPDKILVANVGDRWNTTLPATVLKTCFVAQDGNAMQSCDIFLSEICNSLQYCTSRAVMSRGGKAMDLSTEHRAYGKGKIVKAETARIEAAGGWVKNGRVCDMLAVTRAFGDAEFKGADNRQRMIDEGVRDGYWTKKFASSIKFKSDPVIPTPDVTEINLEDNDEFMVMASDGLWDVYSSTEAIALLRREYANNSSAQDMAELLVKRAISRRTQDNVVVIVVILNKATKSQGKTLATPKKQGLLGMFS